ncbi:MAG: putative lipopolysaccharide heptosyltransferase III [Campylobacteraceae bacterium]|nr:putative lipopolysaccharide heptosyltransferase III [Campylobacteraceae bacterium]
MRILILKFKTIGDVLLVTPLINNLKYFYPESLIDIAVNSGTEEMLTLNQNINKILIYNREKNKNTSILKKIYREYRFVKAIYSSRYNIVIDLDEGDRGAIITMLTSANIKVGSDSVRAKLVKNTYTNFLPKRSGRHTVEVNLDALRVLNIPIKEKKVEIFWSENDEEIINKKLLNINNFIHIHPFSRVDLKELSSTSVATIIDFCEINLGIKVVLTSAPEKEELSKSKKILSLCNSWPINLSGELTLKQVAIVNKKARFFIGVDTAIMHISAANDTPVLAFFGPTNSNIWGPWNNEIFTPSLDKSQKLQIVGKHRVYSNFNSFYSQDVDNGLMSLDVEIIKQQIVEMTNENFST